MGPSLPPGISGYRVSKVSRGATFSASVSVTSRPQLGTHHWGRLGAGPVQGRKSVTPQPSTQCWSFIPVQLFRLVKVWPHSKMFSHYVFLALLHFTLCPAHLAVILLTTNVLPCPSYCLLYVTYTCLSVHSLINLCLISIS